MPGEPRSEPLRFAAPDDGDELARAEVYGLLARLFAAPPDAELQAQLGVAVTAAPVSGAILEHSWGELVGAARRLGESAISREFEALFTGVGKAELLPYASFFVVGRLHEQPLVDVRAAMRELGLEGAGEGAMTEDHIAGICEVMRWLIAGDDVATSNLAAQRRFFDAHLAPWGTQLCDAIEQHHGADFYAALARFARDFFAVEAQAFDLLDT